VCSDRQVFQLRLVGMLSFRRYAAGFSTHNLSRVIPVTSPGALVLNTV